MTDRSLPDLDADIAASLKRVNRTRWVLTLLVAALVLAAVAVLSVVTIADQVKLNAAQQALTRDRAALAASLNRERSSCGFYRDLAGLPLTVGPDGKASRLGVQLVSDSRAAFVGQTCTGGLPPPSPSFTHWAAYYGIPIITQPPSPP